MMEFSNYLREQIKKKNMTVSSFARQTGIERTTLSKVLSGQRLLPYYALDNLIIQLRLTPSEEKKLRSFYEIQFQKNGVSKTKEIIEKMFFDLSNLSFDSNTLEERKVLVDIEEYIKDGSIVLGNLNVRMLLNVVFSEELSKKNNHVEMTIPPNENFINQELMRRYLGENVEAEVTQIIAFDSLENASMENMNNLTGFCQLLPLCLVSNQKYHPYYFYDEYIRMQYMNPFPYFLVTQNVVICLSENGEEAMVLRSEEQIRHYHLYFRKFLDQCHSLVRYTVEPAEILMSYSSCTDDDGYYTMMEQPCFGKYYEDRIVDDYLHEHIPYREIVSEICKKRFRALRNKEQFCTLFTKRGLQRFVETGALDDLPAAWAKPYTKEERKTLIEKMAEDVVSGEITARIYDPDIFPDFLSLTTSVNSGVGFFVMKPLTSKNEYLSMHLLEPTVCNAFHGWLTGLTESRHVLSEEETAKEMLEVLESSL